MSDSSKKAVKFDKGKTFGDWIIQEKLDEGGFGSVYRVEHASEPGRVAALKAEPNDVEGGSAIKLEMSVLKALTAEGEKPHIPTVYHAAKHTSYCYMVMMLLGDNLKNLKLSSLGALMTPETWSRIGIQCLYAIKLVHDYGFIHRDIKPNNFVMGHASDTDRARIVHILDFGLSRSYAMKKDSGWIARRARGTADFRGTLRYCSPNVHLKAEQGRRDDLWGLLYVLIEFHVGLPWQKCYERKEVETMKVNIDDTALMQFMPEECKKLPATLRAVDYYSRPDYSVWAKAFKDIGERLKVAYWDPYDWEKDRKDQLEELKKKTGDKLPVWFTGAEEFFASDPIKISGPPPPGSKKDRKSPSREKSPSKQ